MPLEIPEEARQAYEGVGLCFKERRFVDSIVHAEAAARLCPEWPDPWWSLSVAYKHARRWREALDACDRVIALAPHDAEGPRWNGGIAATALGMWERARAAWTSLGIKVPPGVGPIEMRLGPVPIRVSPEDAPEVVWCERLDPCRGRIRSVPLPASRRRYFDIVLHDGEQRGQRRHGGVVVPVFDELDLLEPSDFRTWEVLVYCEESDTLGALMDQLLGANLGVEDWTANYRILCSACSLGEPHEHEEGPPAANPSWTPERRLGVAAHAAVDLRSLVRAGAEWRGEIVAVERVL